MTEGIEVHTEVFGDPGPGRPVVVVPCVGHGPDFAPLAERAVVVTYDARNRGRSTPVTVANRVGFEIEVADLERVRLSYAVERPSLLGWGYHAAVVAAYALAHPERIDRLVLVAPLPTNSHAAPGEARSPSPQALAEVDQLEADGGRERDPEAVSRAWRRAYLPTQVGDPAAIERITDTSGLPNEYPWHAAAGLIGVLGDLGPYDWRGLLRELAVPLLVVAGTADQEPIEHAAEWAELAPDGRLLTLDGVGRYPWAEAPERFADVVGRFLTGESV